MTIQILPPKIEHKILCALSFTALLILLANFPVRFVDEYNKRAAEHQQSLLISAQNDCQDCVYFGTADICRAAPNYVLPTFLNLILLMLFNEFIRHRRKWKYAASILTNFLALAVYAFWSYAGFRIQLESNTAYLSRLSFTGHLLADSNLLDFMVGGLVLLIFCLQISLLARSLAESFDRRSILK